jgi:hypothetical protein
MHRLSSISAGSALYASPAIDADPRKRANSSLLSAAAARLAQIRSLLVPVASVLGSG